MTNTFELRAATKPKNSVDAVTGELKAAVDANGFRTAVSVEVKSSKCL